MFISSESHHIGKSRHHHKIDSFRKRTNIFDASADEFHETDVSSSVATETLNEKVTHTTR